MTTKTMICDWCQTEVLKHEIAGNLDARIHAVLETTEFDHVPRADLCAPCFRLVLKLGSLIKRHSRESAQRLLTEVPHE